MLITINNFFNKKKNPEYFQSMAVVSLNKEALNL